MKALSLVNLEYAMREIWDRLEAWLREHTPWIYERLGPPATEEQLRQAEEVMGLKLPEDFKESYRIHDGSIPHHIWMRGRGAYYGSRPSGFLYDAEDFENLESIVRNWNYVSLAEFPMDFRVEEPLLCNVQGPIKRKSTHRTKIPVAGGPNMTYYLDMDPDDGGEVGQVIRYTYDDVRAVYIAPSYSSWLGVMTHLLEAEIYVYSPPLRRIESLTYAMQEIRCDLSVPETNTPELEAEYQRLSAILTRHEQQGQKLYNEWLS